MSSAYEDIRCSVTKECTAEGCLIFCTSGSKKRTKSRGERGQPWRVPLCVVNWAKQMWPAQTFAEGFAYKTFIILITCKHSPIFLNVVERCSHHSWLKAFAASSELSMGDQYYYLYLFKG